MTLLTSLLVSAAGALGCWNGRRLFLETRDFVRRAQAAEGSVIGHERSSDPEAGGWAPVIRFESPDGQVVTFTDRIASSRRDPAVGEAVVVKFDPERPTRARLGRTHASQLDAGLFGGVGAAMLLGGLAFLYGLSRTRAVDLGARDYFHVRWACPLDYINVTEDPAAREPALRRTLRAHKAWTGKIAISPSDPSEHPTAVVRTDPGTRTRKERLGLNPPHGGTVDVQGLRVFTVTGCGREVLIACDHPVIHGGEDGLTTEREEVACLSVPPD